MSGPSARPAGPLFDSTKPAEERYRILGRIAAGGMAEIYLSRMLLANGTEREVVLKRLMPELQSDHEFVQMFYDEARIASQMRHPNIVQIYELGELDGSLFISMELLRGVNLRDMLARLHSRSMELPIPHAVRIACGALEALSYAHRFTDASGRLLNVVHRDVSPQNILVTYEGTVKLVDFGVAKAEGRLHQTRAGLIKGKFAYMSPEQISGGKVDGRSDLFALAEVFYELLLRRHPFFATSDMEVLRAILDAEPPHPSAVKQDFPAELGQILVKAMRKAPGDRYPNAAAMLDALEAFLQAQRTPVSSMMLGRFVRDLFIDRVEAEQRARDAGDDDQLIEAMTANKNEAAAPQPRRRSHKGLTPEPATPVEAYSPNAVSGKHRVVEVARTPSPEASNAPQFIAHSGYTDPGLRRRQFQSQVQKLFDDPADSNPNHQSQPEDRPTDLGLPAQSDDGELPTMLGSLSAREMDEIRAARERRARGAVEVQPAKGQGGPQVTRSAQATPRKAPTSREAAVTPRSRTVLQDDPPPTRSDRWGLFLFIAGLGALIGAIIYAAMLYTGAQNPVMKLDVRSKPSGAAIVFDGADTGVQTPTVFQNVASNREHLLELRLEGHEPYSVKLSPSPELGERTIEWTFKPQSGAKDE